MGSASLLSASDGGVDAYRKRTNTGDDVLVRVVDAGASAPAPAVLLLGWFGAHSKHLAKYAARWEALGFSTVAVTAPTSVVFSLNRRNVPGFVLSVLGVVASDARLLAGGLTVHMFSNGGAFCAPPLAAMLAGGMRETVPADREPSLRAVRDALAAVVFDSAPAYMHLEAGVNAFCAGLGVKPGSGMAKILRFVFVALMWVQRLVYGDVVTNYWTGVRTADYGCKELYMYSRADATSDPARIEALVREREQRFKGNVLEFVVDDAPHVRLLVQYPDEYVAQLKLVKNWAVNEWRREHGLDDYNPSA